MKKTAKYLEALDTARTFRITRAVTHAALYGALQRLGFTWSPAAQRWSLTPRAGGESRRKDPLEGLPAARVALDVARLDSLEARLDVLERKMREDMARLHASFAAVMQHPEIARVVGESFGIDLVAGGRRQIAG